MYKKSKIEFKENDYCTFKNYFDRFVDLNNFVDYCESRVKDETNRRGRCSDGYDYILANYYDGCGSSEYHVKKYLEENYEMKEYKFNNTKMFVRRK